MAESEEEGEILEYVTDYHLVNSEDEPVSFEILPFKWGKSDVVDNPVEEVSLSGTTDVGLRKIFKKVVAWKFDLSCAVPVISVLTPNNNWIILQKPRKSFEAVIRTILITVHWLHFVKKNPAASEQSVWNHVLKKFRGYVVEPSEDDLYHHLRLISEAEKKDKDLASSEEIQTEKKSKFIVDVYEDEEEDDNWDEDDESKAIFDTVCAICDNGGELLCCEGKCLRSFHPTISAAGAADATCESIGYKNSKEVEAIQYFFCKNCLYKKHQCFACGRLGSSDDSNCQEVFPCDSATCGHFYHPECVAKLIHVDDGTQAKDIQNKIVAGESFTCPAHKCSVCKQCEDTDVSGLQFAICRRCPKVYHRNCLPRDITESHVQRAWDGLLPHQRVLIYCMEHEIDGHFNTPTRNHLIFPDVGRKAEMHTSERLSSKQIQLSKRTMVSESCDIDRTAIRKHKMIQTVAATGEATAKMERICIGHDFKHLRKPNVTDVRKKSSKDNISFASGKANAAARSKLHQQNHISVNLGSKPLKSTLQKIPSSKVKDAIPEVDTEMENSIMSLMDDVNSSFDEDKLIKELKVPSTYANNFNRILGKSITLGLVEGSVKAVRTTLQKLEDGSSIEDAKAICQPEILRERFRWKRELKIYLAPILIGTRYTSFGRHFTQVDKLKEIVDRLHSYVQDGDTVVDCCCGSNDFSCLMKEKLVETGKSCSFKNYDIMPPKNDFCFEKRDWMKVDVDELPHGSQLIMGLNPPFGVKASLANNFIKKALEFKPKLLVLIVPGEAIRVDIIAQYDLLWEDDQLLSGKSFYLPGSVDVHGKQLDDWNLKPPPLYLWSRSDWTDKHIAIAQELGHLKPYVGSRKNQTSN